MKKGSIPSIFTDYPTYMQPSSSTRREPKKRKLDEDSCEIDAANTLLSLSASEPEQMDTNDPDMKLKEVERKRKCFGRHDQKIE